MRDVVASHVFFPKPHRHTPKEDTLLRRVTDVVYVVAVASSNILADWIEDDARRVAAWWRSLTRRRRH